MRIRCLCESVLKKWPYLYERVVRAGKKFPKKNCNVLFGKMGGYSLTPTSCCREEAPIVVVANGVMHFF